MYSDPVRGGSEPDRRWNLALVGEATPEVLSALCWSVWRDGVELGGRTAMRELAVLPWSAVRRSDVPDECLTAAFFGRQALNVELVGALLAPLPGAAGLLDDPAPAERAQAVRMSARARLAARGFRNRPEQVHDRNLRWWREVVLEAPVEDPLALLADSALRFRVAMCAHAHVRMMLSALRSRVLDEVGATDRPELVGAALGGYGQVVATALADDVWELGRHRLSPEDFIRRHGFHGPGEGNPIGRSWREDPAIVTTLATAGAGRPDPQAPRARESAAVGRRIAAETQLLAEVPSRRRRAVRAQLDELGHQVRALEITKTAYLIAIDGCRRAVREHGAALAESGLLEEPDDAFHFTKEELLGGLPAEAREIATFRRARRKEYQALEIPSTFTGAPEPVPTSIDDPAVLIGISGSPGVVEGAVRVLTDPGAGDVPGDGEVLVTRIAGPGWTPLLSLSAAVVVDIGSPVSHAAIVAREWGLPCVVGTGSATRILRDGELVRVDGRAGTVARL